MSHHNLKKEIQGNTLKGAAGFVGAVGAIFLLPRLVRYAIRNYFFRAAAEIIAIVTLGLLTEKFATWISRHESGVPAAPVEPNSPVSTLPVEEPVP